MFILNVYLELVKNIPPIVNLEEENKPGENKVLFLADSSLKV